MTIDYVDRIIAYELRTPAIAQYCGRGICVSTFGYGHCECPCKDCIVAGIHHG